MSGVNVCGERFPDCNTMAFFEDGSIFCLRACGRCRSVSQAKLEFPSSLSYLINEGVRLKEVQSGLSLLHFYCPSALHLIFLQRRSNKIKYPALTSA